MTWLIVGTIVIGLAFDQHGGAYGQPAVSLVAWGVLGRLWLTSSRAHRPALVACLVYATAGEVVLSLGWGLYDYRLGNLPLFVPPGHVLLFYLGTQVAPRLKDGAEWAIAAVAVVVVSALAWTGRDTLGPFLALLVLACMTLSRSRKLYATMLVLAMAMELWGTWLGNWAWRREVPWLGLVTANPPLAAGAFYAALDMLVVLTMDARRKASPERAAPQPPLAAVRTGPPT